MYGVLPGEYSVQFSSRGRTHQKPSGEPGVAAAVLGRIRESLDAPTHVPTAVSANLQPEESGQEEAMGLRRRCPEPDQPAGEEEGPAGAKPLHQRRGVDQVWADCGRHAAQGPGGAQAAGHVRRVQVAV